MTVAHSPTVSLVSGVLLCITQVLCHGVITRPRSSGLKAPCCSVSNSIDALNFSFPSHLAATAVANLHVPSVSRILQPYCVRSDIVIVVLQRVSLVTR